MRMAPINKMKTYNKPNRNLVNNSLDAGKILFPGIKTRKKKKKKLQIKELPVRAVSETLFGQDSFHVSTEDTFDKLVKGNIYNPVNIKSHISIVNSSDSDVSKSIKRVNNFYSPIMMRRKKSASITEIHSNSNIGIGENKSNNAKSMIKTNDFYSPIMTRNRKRTAYIMDKTDSSISASGNNRNESEIPHFREPTVEKIDFSLEVEQARNAVPNSLSYIVIPEVKVGEISIGEVPPNHVSASKIDRSFDSFFTKTFREKQLIHSSTPLLPMKTKKMVNHTISPIKNVSRFEGSINIEKPNSTIFKNSSIPLKAANSTNIEYVLEEDWKLLAEPKVMLTINSEKGIKSLINNSESNTSEKLQNEMESQDKENLSLVNNSIPPRLSVNNMPREDFITLRRRKILKLDSGNRKRSRNTQGQKGYNICAEDFERCSVNVTKKSRSTETSEQGIKQRSVCDELSQTSTPSLQDDFVNERYKNKELVVDLTKYPWRCNGEQSIPSLGSSAEIVVINLTDSFEGKDITHTDAVKDVSVSRDEHIEKDSIPDIIESSVLEPSHVDEDGFKIPGSGARRHRSKTLVLKAGKLWRRSLAMYKRSSMMLNALNDNACRLVGGERLFLLFSYLYNVGENIFQIIRIKLCCRNN